MKIQVSMRVSGEPLKRAPVSVVLDHNGDRLDTRTDRNGLALVDIEPVSGKVLVDGVARYHGRLEGHIRIALWSPTESGLAEDGAPGGAGGGSTAYPGMQTRSLEVNGRSIATDSEGYLVNLDDWSEAFARAQAVAEGLDLTSEHWQVVRFLREYYEAHGVQASVRDIIKHFAGIWGREKGNNRYLHDLFPRGGPQKQGNRLAGLLRTKGEH
ncbi:MAG: TusE/DsrC/DsvC family sulfur relay protein [Gammaproteobacteria bacterium]|jgi:tRNA 2-thiouridine synthesizing protein E